MSSLPEFEPFAARAPNVADRGEILKLAAGAGAHGVYVTNDLARDTSGRLLCTRGLAFFGRDGVGGFAWFGARGNLIVLGASEHRLDSVRVADEIEATGFDWRIALGPEPVLAAMAERLRPPPVLVRRQVYYVAIAEAVLAQAVAASARLASMADLDALVQASLELNELDLHLDPNRISRRWLRQTTRERLRAGTAWAIGPAGAPYAKLDVGSQGAAGVVIEGVYTVPAERGAGHAMRLVHAVAHQQLRAGRPLVCLHVAESNAPARRCYEKAGMVASLAVGLLLRG